MRHIFFIPNFFSKSASNWSLLSIASITLSITFVSVTALATSLMFSSAIASTAALRSVAFPTSLSIVSVGIAGALVGSVSPSCGRFSVVWVVVVEGVNSGSNLPVSLLNTSTSSALTTLSVAKLPSLTRIVSVVAWCPYQFLPLPFVQYLVLLFPPFCFPSLAKTPPELLIASISPCESVL